MYSILCTLTQSGVADALSALLVDPLALLLLGLPPIAELDLFGDADAADVWQQVAGRRSCSTRRS